jgi:hypothetical protein
MRFHPIISVFVVASGLVACGDNNNRLRERAQIEGEAAATADNQIRATRAQELEADLEERHRFNQAIAGTYEGKFKTASGTETRVRLRLVSSLPAYRPGDRIRTLEEIQKDLETLYLNASLKLMDEAPRSGCNFTQVKPDLRKAEFNLVREMCSESVFVQVNSPDSRAVSSNTSAGARILPAEILEGKVPELDSLYVTLSSLNWTRDVSLSLQRVAGSTNDPIDDSDIMAGTSNSVQRVIELERDLANRMSVFDRIAGTYSGSVVIPPSYSGSKDLELRFRISIYFLERPIIPTDRLRSEEEVRDDIQNLHFKVEVLETEVPFTCVFDDVKPEMGTGQMNLVSQDCTVKTFGLSLDDPSNITDLKMDLLKENLSEEIDELFVDFRLRGVSYPIRFLRD